MSEDRQRNVFHTCFASYISHSNPFKVRYPLQMLEPFSTVFDTEQTLRKLSFLVLSRTLSTKNKKTDQSHRNNRTLRAIDEPFYCELVSNSTDNLVIKTSLNCLILAMDPPSPVRERQPSFVHWSRALFFLSMSQNVQTIVAGGSTKGRIS